MGPGIARRLGIPQLTYVNHVAGIDQERKEIKVHRKLDDAYEVVVAKLPCLLTVEKEINELRYSSLPNMLRAVRFQPKILTVADLQADLSMMGLKGSPTSVSKIFAPPQRNGGEFCSVEQLVEKLMGLSSSEKC